MVSSPCMWLTKVQSLAPPMVPLSTSLALPEFISGVVHRKSKPQTNCTVDIPGTNFSSSVYNYRDHNSNLLFYYRVVMILMMQLSSLHSSVQSHSRALSRQETLWVRSTYCHCLQIQFKNSILSTIPTSLLTRNHLQWSNFSNFFSYPVPRKETSFDNCYLNSQMYQTDASMKIADQLNLWWLGRSL